MGLAATFVSQLTTYTIYSTLGLEDLAKGFHEMGVLLLASGGTATKIRSMGLPVRDVADITKAPEMLGGMFK